ncbi:MAG: AbrB/MazE/SpoVT family DNA-binding domain-containing protein [Euryarchaeota archaeon]|nr:AbrB/MazE/SpoVT family DNA-binding domain-containing protein [Euryarchaeota archaeon]
MESGLEIKKVDSQGRFVLPADWRESELKESQEVYIIKRKEYLKIIPKRKVDLSKLFDKVDLGIESIKDWKVFEKKFFARDIK